MNEIMIWFKESEIWASVDAGFTMVSILVTLGTFRMVIKNYLSNKKQLEKVQLLISDKKDNLIPVQSYILRKNFNRVEVKGILKELNIEKEYAIDYISNPKSSFLKDIFEIQNGRRDELVINVIEGDKFDLKEMLWPTQNKHTT